MPSYRHANVPFPYLTSLVRLVHRLPVRRLKRSSLNFDLQVLQHAGSWRESARQGSDRSSMHAMPTNTSGVVCRRQSLHHIVLKMCRMIGTGEGPHRTICAGPRPAVTNEAPCSYHLPLMGPDGYQQRGVVLHLALVGSTEPQGLVTDSSHNHPRLKSGGLGESFLANLTQLEMAGHSILQDPERAP